MKIQKAIEIPKERVDELRERLKRNSQVMPNGCWEWKLWRNKHGYGYTSCADTKGGSHRFSYAAFKGPIPANIDVLHSCDNPPCINPDHLSLGTDKDNAADRARKGRSKTPMMKLTVKKDGVLMCRKGLHQIVGSNLLEDGPTPRCRKCKCDYNLERGRRLRSLNHPALAAHGKDDK